MRTREIIAVSAVVLAAATGQAKAEPAMLAPVQAGDFVVGASHIVAAYVAREGSCELVALVEARDGDMPAGAPTRLSLTLAAGDSARLDSPDGSGIVLTCGEGAGSMAVERLYQRTAMN